MNRNEEWQLFIDEVKNDIPSHIEFSAQNAVCKAKSRFHIKTFIKAPLASLFAIIIIFVTLVNMSLSFGKALKSFPILLKIAKLVTFNPNMKNTIIN